jgi:cyclic pyranopterin monophosphate synthase
MPGKRSSRLTHVDAAGKARMVDVTEKPPMDRRAVARGEIRAAKRTIRLIRDNALAKGDVLAVAELAGIQAAKRTSELIPLTHPIALTHVAVKCRPVLSRGVVEITAEARCRGETGVEMEALTAAAVAALTIYDMAKAVDRSMVIGEIALIEKTKR